MHLITIAHSSDVGELERIVNKAANKYYDKTGRPVIIVIDNLHSDGSENTELVNHLQQWAKESNCIRFAFITNDIKTTTFMMSTCS